jgi:hypothetical protein
LFFFFFFFLVYIGLGDVVSLSIRGFIR